ncbi:unnamed protein product [Brassica napus]|uniref:(rape) hypothetical protein n=1 Tax=Brassica napus TaxID=3708 RepID=A0A816R013_BRANA|nr:unnamed protein product [Brassica napus]
MVVETRRGKRKENPTEEEAPRVKFVKTASREKLEKTTTKESETRAVEIVESTTKTTDESMAKTTDESTAKTTDVSTEKTMDVSTEKTTDVSTEKMKKDSTENTAEITEPSNVAAEAAPTTLKKKGLLAHLLQLLPQLRRLGSPLEMKRMRNPLRR